MNIMKQQEATWFSAHLLRSGFKNLHKRFEKKVIVSGKSKSALDDYMP
jgi:hypothetical protein